jgi:penicillin-binding protein 2
MKAFAIFCIALFAILLARLWYLQIAIGDQLLADSEMNRKRLIRVRAPRGLILDRKGRVLATSRPQFVVLAIPEVLNEHPQALATLCSILKITEKDLKSIISKERAAALAPVRVAIDVPLDVVAKLQERKPILPGVSVEMDQLRSYPDGPLAAHILGYIGEVNKKELERFEQAGITKYQPGDYVGKAGIEKQYEQLLHGQDGGQEIEVDAQIRTRRILGNKAPIPGATLTLTIDRDLQIAAERLLEGRAGAAVAVNPQTGEVLAMVSKPDFDPNIFVKKVRIEDWNKIIQNKANPLQNRAIANIYPPGSTFKAVTATAALQNKVCTTNTGMYCSGVGLYHRRCWKRHGGVNFTTAISQSCDVFFYEMGRRLGIGRLAKMARAFGLGTITNIDLPEEIRRSGDTRKGTVPDEEWKRTHFRNPALRKWQPGETVICAIGQGFVQASPLQMALVCSAVSTSGKIYLPHVLKEARTSDASSTIIKSFQPKLVRQVPASPEVFKAVQYGMRQTVIGPGGTGRVVNLEGITVAGKTGSAEDPPRKKPHGWFICFAPVENPQIAIAVICEQGGHGSTSAAPAARALLDVYFGKKKASEIKASIVHVSGD